MRFFFTGTVTVRASANMDSKNPPQTLVQRCSGVRRGVGHSFAPFHSAHVLLTSWTGHKHLASSSPGFPAALAFSAHFESPPNEAGKSGDGKAG